MLEPACDVAVGRGVLGSGLGLLPDLIEALTLSGETAAACRYATDFAAATADADDPLVAALRYRVLALTQDDPDCAAELFELALTRHDKARSGFDEARTRLLFGQRLRRAGRRADARAHLLAAAASFGALQASPWRARADAELSALGVRRRKASTPESDVLTPQEFRVARLVAEGRTNKDVAAELIVSVKTVEFHLGRIYTKLGLRTRTELVRHLLQDRSRDHRMD